MSRLRLGRLAGIWAGVVLVCLLPAPAFCEIVDEVEVGHTTFAFQFGYAQTRMGKYNENIDVLNEWLTHQGIPLREAASLKGAGAVRGELRHKFGNRFSVGLGVGNTQAKSTFYVTFGDVDFFTRATVWSAMGYYHLPFVDNFGAIADRMSLYVGAGPILLTNAFTHMRIADRTTEPGFNNEGGDLSELDGEGNGKGNGKGLQGIVGASYQLNTRFSVAGEVGYRLAKIKDLETYGVRGYTTREFGDADRPDPVDGAITDFFGRDHRPDGLPQTETGTGRHIPYYTDFGNGPLDLDFSGVLAQVAFRIHLF